MRRALPAIALLATGVAAAWYFFFVDPEPAVPDVPTVIDEHGPSVRVDGSGRPILEVHRSAAEAGGSLRERGAESDVRYQLVDADSGAPIAGARLYGARRGEVLATTDTEGFATVAGGMINALVFSADGYLLDHYFDRPSRVRAMARELAREKCLRVPLVRDDLTTPCRLRFVRVDGSLAAGVEFKIACLDEPPPDGRAVPSSRLGPGALVPEDLRQAWARHVLLSTLRRPDFNPASVHFGVHSHTEVFTCQGEAAVRFVATGAYRIEARAGDEFCRQSFAVSAPSSAITIELREGRFFTGQVISSHDQQPIVGAAVALHRGESIVTSDTTDVSGHFKLGPVAETNMRFEVHHQAFERLEVRGVRAGGPAAVYELVPVACHAVRGTVRRQPDLSPVPNATVRLVSGDGDGVVAAAKTDAGGGFELRSVLIEPTVEIAADGYLKYVEMLNANGEPRHFDLIPATPAERMRVGLTGVVAGRVLDQNGNPAANRPVQVHSLTASTPNGIPGRRILSGGQPLDSSTVVTDAKGEFEIEWTRAEAVRLLAPMGTTQPEDGYVVNVKLGQRHEVVLRDAR